MLSSPVAKSTVESIVRAVLVAAATWAGVEFGADTLGTTASALAVLLVAAISIAWSAITHKRNVLTPPPGGGPLLMLALVCLAGFGMIGCQPVGPVRTVGTVQTSNDPLNASSVVEGSDEFGNATIAWNDSTNGPVSTVKQTESENLVRKTGQVTREISFRDGQRQLLISTGADISAEAVVIDPANGVMNIGRFSTSSSEPIRALNEGLDRYQAVWAQLSQEQRAAIEAQLDAIKVISPDLFDVLKGLIGLP
jgi:hypothetical protein